MTATSTTIDNDPQRYQYRPFPTGVLPEPMKSFVREQSSAIGCDAAFVALPTISMLGAAIGTSRRIRLKRGWCEPSIFWTVVVASSGSGKTPAMTAALRPAYERQRVEIDEHDQLMAAHELEIEDHDKQVQEWKKYNKDPEQRPVKPTSMPEPLE